MLAKELSGQFDDAVAYAEEIHRLNHGSGMAMVVIHRDRVVTEHYVGFHSQMPGARGKGIVKGFLMM
jgi:hypothetical protein